MAKRKWLIVKAGMVGVAILILSVLHRPMLLGIWEARSQVKVHKRKVSEARSWRQITQKLEQENQSIQTQLTAFEKTISKDEVLSKIIGFLQNKGLESSMRFLYLKPQRPRSSAGFQEFSFEIGLKGTYHNLGKFLFALESSQNVIQVQSLEIQTKDMTSKELNVSLKIALFFMKQTFQFGPNNER